MSAGRFPAVGRRERRVRPWARSAVLARSGLLLALGSGAAALALACGETELIASALLPDDNPPIIGEGGLGNVPTDPPPYDAAPTLFTFGGKLRDHCGEELALRGVAELIAWTPGQDGTPEYFEIAKTGANAVRIMWREDASAVALDQALSGARAQGLIPVLELQLGSFRSIPEADALATIMEYWLAPDVAAVLLAHQSTLVLELSSWVTQSALAADWVEMYAAAIADLRALGLLSPISVVHPTWSEDLPRYSQAMADLLALDSVGNVLGAFDVWRGSITAASDKWGALGAVGVAGYVSEFSSHTLLNCPASPIDGPALLDAAQAAGGGWFAWAWGSLPSSGCPGDLIMTTDGTFATLTQWGSTIALEHPAGLARATVALRTTAGGICPM